MARIRRTEGPSHLAQAKHRQIGLRRHPDAARLTWLAAFAYLQARSLTDDLVDLLSASSHTPSRSVARHEAIAAVPDGMVDALYLVGSKDRIRDRFQRWKDSPVGTMMVGSQDMDTLRFVAELNS